MAHEPASGKQPPLPQDLRAVMGRPFGEIVAAVIGDRRIREMFEKTPKKENEAESPAGDIALQTAVITPGTKTALLVAQAAERTLRLAEKTADFLAREDQIAAEVDARIQKRKEEKKAQIMPPQTRMKAMFQKKAVRNMQNEELGRAYRKLRDESMEQARRDLGYLSLEHDSFAYIGAARDPDLLKSAQATHLAAQMYLNYELERRFGTGSFIGEYAESIGAKYTEGLKASAARFYNNASDLLALEGHGEAAEGFRAIARDIVEKGIDASAPGPESLVKAILAQESNNVARADADLDYKVNSLSPRWDYDHAQCDRLLWMIPLQEAAESDLAQKTIAASGMTMAKSVKPMKTIRLRQPQPAQTP